jgi:hypothetical protein
MTMGGTITCTDNGRQALVANNGWFAGLYALGFSFTFIDLVFEVSNAQYIRDLNGEASFWLIEGGRYGAGATVLNFQVRGTQAARYDAISIGLNVSLLPVSIVRSTSAQAHGAAMPPQSGREWF